MARFTFSNDERNQLKASIWTLPSFREAIVSVGLNDTDQKIQRELDRGIEKLERSIGDRLKKTKKKTDKEERRKAKKVAKAAKKMSKKGKKK